MVEIYYCAFLILNILLQVKRKTRIIDVGANVLAEAPIFGRIFGFW